MNRIERAFLILGCCAIAAACSDDDKDPAADTGVDVGDAGDAGDAGDVDETGDPPADVPRDTDADEDVGPVAFDIPALSAPVEVYFDEWGIPHISCQTNADCAAALGYVHARDRFAQMDIRRRVTTGRLHQLVGALAIDIDVANRNLYSTPDGRPAEEALLDNLSADTLALLEAYSSGVNAWLADYEAGTNGAVLQDEYGFAIVNVDEIPPWTPADCLSTVLALINSLTNDSDRELALGEAYASVPAEMAADLWGPAPAIASVIQSDYTFPKSNGAVRAPLVGAELIERLREARPAITDALDGVRRANVLREFDPDAVRGSNNWVLAPSQTASGVGLLSNDPHLGLSNPAVWYYAHVDSRTNGTGDYHAAGQSFAGMPWIVIGHNEHIAWGATNTTLDQSDVYIETLSPDGEGVMFEGEAVPFVEVDFTLDPYDGDPVTRQLLFVPHHGPVLSIDREAGTAVSLAWTGNRVTTDGNFLTEMMRASTVAEARDACRNITTIGQNWVVVDTEGSIGWFPYNHVPTRPWASMELPSFLPVPGDGSAEWGDWIPYEALPQLYNPEAGYIATANNDMTGALTDGDPFNDGTTPLQVYVAAGYRHARIVELLEAGAGAHDVASMQATISDTFSAFGRDIVPEVLALLDGRELEAPASDLVAALRDWDYGCPTGVAGVTPDSAPSEDAEEAASSVGCSAFHVLVGRLMVAVFGDELAQYEAPMGADVEALVRLLKRPETMAWGAAFWDDTRTDFTETAEDVVAGAVAAAAEWLVERFDADPDTWRWGYLHTVTLRADLFDSFGVETYNNGPWVNDGGMYTVDVAAPRSVVSHRYGHTSGASTRFVCEVPASGIRCQVQMPGGQRHFRDSPNYQDGLDRWLVNEPYDLAFSVSEVAAVAASSIRFEPTSD